MNWSKYPFLRLLPPLLAGILMGEALGPFHIGARGLFLVLLLLVGIMAMLSRTLKQYRYRWVFGVLVLMVLVLLGWLRQQMVSEVGETVGLHGGPGSTMIARVIESPQVKERSVKVVLELRGCRTLEGDNPVSGKVMAYLEKTDRALKLRYGDLICFWDPIEAVPPPLNPGEFDYQAYLRRQGVTGRVYLQEDRWHELGVREGNPLRRIAYSARDQLLEALQRCGVTEDAFGVGAALLLGYDESLPAQLRQQYVAAGAMHVLCVSGMHVGVVYLLASSLLDLLLKRKWMVRLKKALLLVLVWSYAMITGLSPSVLRATLMISFLILGALLRKKGNTLNTVAASAFMLLVFNPNHLFAIGFQLSYAAVLGIVLLQRPVYNLLYVKNKLLDKAWEITAVSLTAQLFTLPLTLYHFHQFTPYFWLSNLFLAPLSFVAILTGMGLLAVSWIPWICTAMGKLVWGSLSLMNLLVSWVERLPGSVIRGLYINKVELALLLLLLVMLVVFLNFKKKRMLMESLALGCCLSLSLAVRSESVARQTQLTLYALRNHTCVDLIVGTEHLMLCDEGLLEDSGAIDYSLRGNWARCQLSGNPSCYILSETVDHPLVVKHGNLLSFQGCLLAFWDSTNEGLTNVFSFDAPAVAPMPVDLVVVRGKQPADLNKLICHYTTPLLLIDGSVPAFRTAAWMEQAEQHGIPYYNIREGAWMRRFEDDGF